MDPFTRLQTVLQVGLCAGVVCRSGGVNSEVRISTNALHTTRFAKMTDKLRALLDEMTQDNSQVETHPARLVAITRDVPHSVRVLPALFEKPLGDFNCVMYALGLTTLIEKPCRLLGRFYADTAFLHSLIDCSILQPCAEADGELVVWSLAGTIKHVGVTVAPGRAASKWGIGYVYEHGLLEVPKSYGEALAFYGAIDSNDALNHLCRYWTRGRCV